MGRRRADASIPAPPGRGELPADYAAVLGEIKERIRAERVRVVLAANQAMVLLYWDIGKAILARPEREGWGARTIDRLSHDLREAFPDMRGFSPRNLKYMCAFATAWPDRAIVQQAAAQIPWFHNCVLLDKVSDLETRLWYIAKAREEGWSRSVLILQIERRLHQRQGKAITNFPQTLPQSESDLATQAFQDPYVFDFLGTAEPRTERELDQGLVDHIQRFLLEMEAGFAFVGRQVLLGSAIATSASPCCSTTSNFVATSSSLPEKKTKTSTSSRRFWRFMSSLNDSTNMQQNLRPIFPETSRY